MGDDILIGYFIGNGLRVAVRWLDGTFRSGAGPVSRELVEAWDRSGSWEWAQPQTRDWFYGPLASAVTDAEPASAQVRRPVGLSFWIGWDLASWLGCLVVYLAWVFLWAGIISSAASAGPRQSTIALGLIPQTLTMPLLGALLFGLGAYGMVVARRRSSEGGVPWEPVVACAAVVVPVAVAIFYVAGEWAYGRSVFEQVPLVAAGSAMLLLGQYVALVVLGRMPGPGQSAR